MNAPLRLSHFHVKVRDLDAALAWFQTVCKTQPAFNNGKLAYLRLGETTLVLEPAANDLPITLAFHSDDCDRDFQELVAAGAEPLEGPDSKPWGVRGAYLRGPAAITFELEQRL